jgi:hypothetical protein
MAVGTSPIPVDPTDALSRLELSTRPGGWDGMARFSDALPCFACLWREGGVGSLFCLLASLFRAWGHRQLGKYSRVIPSTVGVLPHPHSWTPFPRSLTNVSKLIGWIWEMNENDWLKLGLVQVGSFKVFLLSRLGVLYEYYIYRRCMQNDLLWMVGWLMMEPWAVQVTATCRRSSGQETHLTTVDSREGEERAMSGLYTRLGDRETTHASSCLVTLRSDE